MQSVDGQCCLDISLASAALLCFPIFCLTSVVFCCLASLCFAMLVLYARTDAFGSICICPALGGISTSLHLHSCCPHNLQYRHRHYSIFLHFLSHRLVVSKHRSFVDLPQYAAIDLLLQRCPPPPLLCIWQMHQNLINNDRSA